MPLASNQESLGEYPRDRDGLMLINGGLDIPFGRPDFSLDPEVIEPEELKISLTQLGRKFSDIMVTEGQKVAAGDELARADAVKLCAPVAGEVAEVSPSRRREDGFIRIKTAEGAETPLTPPGENASPEEMRTFAAKAGLWNSIMSGMLSEPPLASEDPKAIIVRCVFAEPHLPRGADLIRHNLDAFIDGLKIIQKMSGGYASILLTIPKIASALGAEIRNYLRGEAFVHVVDVPIKYPVGNPLLLCTTLGRHRNIGPESMWVVDPQLVLALTRAFKEGHFWGTRQITVSGPAIEKSIRVKVPVGTSVRSILEGRTGKYSLEQCAVLRGGLYTGERIGPEENIQVRDSALTVIPEDEPPEFLGWQNPGLERHSWTWLFGSWLRPYGPFTPRTLVRGDRRTCIHCGFCRDACPAGLYPHHLNRLVTHDLIEEAEEAGLLNCMECGSCSYGCVGKLELADNIIKARHALLLESEE
ncbi:MAG: 4Fe-4S dicluster domain-containing protein [Planctomycetota bacterium]